MFEEKDKDFICSFLKSEDKFSIYNIINSLFELRMKKNGEKISVEEIIKDKSRDNSEKALEFYSLVYMRAKKENNEIIKAEEDLNNRKIKIDHLLYMLMKNFVGLLFKLKECETEKNKLLSSTRINQWDFILEEIHELESHSLEKIKALMRLLKDPLSDKELIRSEETLENFEEAFLEVVKKTESFDENNFSFSDFFKIYDEIRMKKINNNINNIWKIEGFMLDMDKLDIKFKKGDILFFSQETKNMDKFEVYKKEIYYNIFSEWIMISEEIDFLSKKYII